MFGSKATKAEGTIDCLIGSGTVIEGDLRFRGGLRIDGEVIGRVIAEPGKPSLLVLSENAKVRGEIRAARVVIDGTVEGPVQADELLELQARARVSGDIRYTVVEVQHGAIVDGAILHLDGKGGGKSGKNAVEQGAERAADRGAGRSSVMGAGTSAEGAVGTAAEGGEKVDGKPGLKLASRAGGDPAA